MKTLNQQASASGNNRNHIRLSGNQELESFLHRLSDREVGIIQYQLEHDGKSVLMNSVLQSSDHLRNRCIIAEISVDETTSFNREHGLKSVPSLLLVRAGRVLQQYTGLLSRYRLQNIVSKIHPMDMGQTG